jgi:recombination protein RecT
MSDEKQEPNKPVAAQAAPIKLLSEADRKLAEFKQKIEGYLPKEVIAQIAASNVKPERVLKVVLANAARNPKLLACDIGSVAQAVLNAAELGFEAGSATGEAYLVPFKDYQSKTMKCQLIIGYQGYLALARRSGEISYVIAQIVYENDTYKLDVANGYVSHVPLLKGPRGPMLFAYAKTRYRDGGETLTVMTKDDIDAIMRRSKSYDKQTDEAAGPWKTDYGEMARKTVLRRHLKTTARSIERIATALAYDQEADLERDARPEPLAQQVTRAQGFLSRLAPRPAGDIVDVPTTPELPTFPSYELPSTPELDVSPEED